MAVEPKTRMPQSFAERLIELRKSRGLSCNRLAQLADVDQGTLNKIELGKRSPTDEVLRKLAPILDVPFDQLKAWADAERLGEEGLEALKKYVLEFPREDARVSDEGLVDKMLELLGDLKPQDREALLNKAASIFKRKTTNENGPSDGGR